MVHSSFAYKNLQLYAYRKILSCKLITLHAELLYTSIPELAVCILHLMSEKYKNKT